MNIENKILENGLKIYAIDLKDNSNVVSVNIFYKVGSSYEIMGQSGIAHLLEHLSFKSTKTHKAGEFDEIIKSLGGVNNACTSFDYTQYYVTIPKEHIKRVLELYASMMDEVLFEKDEFYKERDVVLEEERLSVANDAFGYFYNAIYNYAFIKSSYHWTPIGFADDIANLSPKIVKNFYNKFYAPNNASIVIAGDLKDVDVFKITSEIFKNKKAKKIIFNDFIEPDRNGFKEINLKFPNLNLELFALAYKIPAFNNEDFKYLKAISLFLNLDKNSKIKNEMINELELCSDLEFYVQNARTDGLFIIFGFCNENINANKAAKTLRKLIKKYIFDANSLTTIKNQLELIFNKIKSNPSQIASKIGNFECLGDFKILFDLYNTSNLEVKKLNKIYKKYLNDDNLIQFTLKEKK